jgi:hypothetical protein
MLQGPVIAGTPQPISARITDLRAKAGELKLRLSDLEVRKNQLGEQRRLLAADVDRSSLDKQLADAEHQLVETRIQFEATQEQIGDLETERDMSRAFTLQPPPPAPADPFLGPEQITTIYTGGIVLLLPLVLVLARRLWVRGPRREAMDFENSPRLQRIEQAIESIAVEVERIGEAQRFTTKLLADRQPDAAARIGVVPRREPGTITPH